ncbi:hypothetical protein NDU88_006053 [Pleurodeles waltl]|uniref:Uncharacterized protein n=1 Tax=Pleurodeles waltl TaxID=8319 RepID=A0AAV7RNH1_PLEWA|nr:hypothetical protein NDU88_006053 [Pleurodeles waltl]
MTEILGVIHRSRQMLESKMDTMPMGISHLRLELRNVTERVTITEEDVTNLKKDVKELQAVDVGLKCNVHGGTGIGHRGMLEKEQLVLPGNPGTSAEHLLYA